MAGTTIFWDGNFTVKSLTPRFEDYTGTPLTSPQTVSSSSSVILVTDEALSIELFPEAGSSTLVTIELSKAAVGAFAAEDGVIAINLNEVGGSFELPLNDINEIRITNDEAGSRDIPFIIKSN